MAIQAALTFWKEFSVQEFQKDLDSQATEIAKRQDESDVSRKKLIELSREFKKNSSEEVRRKVAPLLKAFQGEVDAQSRRGQAAEGAFLSSYKRMIEIPDPVPVLEQAVGVQQRLMAAQDHEVQNKKLKETLEEYKSEFAQVKNQEVTINRLREKLKEMEDGQEQRMADLASEKETEILKSYQERERELQASSSLALSHLSDAEARAATLKTALETTQSELLELKNKYDEEAHAKAAELEILITDLERANQHALSAEREVESLRTQTNGKSANQALDKVHSERVELELELQARDKEISRLVEDVQKLQANLTRLREASDAQVNSLEQQLAEKAAALKEVESQLISQKDYEELKRELNVIKMIEFSSSSAVQTSGRGESAQPSKPLEVLLLEKNRALQNENMSLKLELSELRDHFSSLQTQHSAVLQTVQEQKDLIGQLEADLLRAQPYISVRTEGEGQASSLSSANIMSDVLRDIEGGGGEGGGRGKRGDSESEGASSLLPIVSSQRERFKQRNSELEAECRQQRSSMMVLQREVDSLRADNVKLYEKIKFLQSYPGTRKSVDDRDTLSRYSVQYEAQLDPFSAFSAQERERKYRQLNGPDKATLVLGRFILSNRIARIVAFFYTILLHLLIFLVIFKLTNTQDCERDLYSGCAKRFTEHMQLFHPAHAQEVLDTLKN